MEKINYNSKNKRNHGESDKQSPFTLTMHDVERLARIDRDDASQLYFQIKSYEERLKDY